MSRVKQLQRAMPEAAMFACVRNPYDAIASWKTSFPHLRDADIAKLPLGNAKDVFLSDIEKFDLHQITTTRNSATRRALFWRYLAEIIVCNLNTLTVLRYEDIVTDPNMVVAKIFDRFPEIDANRDALSLKPSEIRTQRNILDDDDITAIRSICGGVARLLGYDVGAARSYDHRSQPS